MQKVCYFGTYEKNYSRNRILIEGLRKNGVQVRECNYNLWGKKEHKAKKGFLFKVKFAFSLLFAYIYLSIKYLFIKEKTIIVGYPGHFDVVFLKLLRILGKKKIIFDAFLSLYDSMVNDRRVVEKGSFAGKVLFLADRYSCKFADRVIIDTNEHIKFFAKTFNISKKKFCRVWIGADDNVFHPLKTKKYGKFTIIFHGKFIPLQGVQYIIEAANILRGEGIRFKIIGDGQLRKEIEQTINRNELANVELLGFIDNGKIPGYISRSHIGLGIFGDTEKARRVIPNKAYEILAMKIPLITGDSPASRELLKDGESCILCKMADGKAIAEAVLKIKSSKILQRKLATNGYKLYKSQCSPRVLGRMLKSITEDE